MLKKVKLIIIIAIIVVITIVVLFLSKNGQPSHNFVKVERNNIVQEVSETGQVEKGEEVNLSFKSSARIEKIYVKVGEIVFFGSWLARIDIAQLNIQLEEAKASLELAKAKEESAKTSLINNQQNFLDIEADAAEDLKQAYQDALNTLDEAFLKINNAFNTVDSIQTTYFYGSDQESLEVKSSRSAVQSEMNKVKTFLETAESSSDKEKTETALSETVASLNIVYEKLSIIRNNCEESSYRASISSTDKTSLDNHKSYIISIRNDLVDDQQTITSTKITNQTNKNTAQAKIASSEKDINLYQAEIKRAESEVALLENQLEDSLLKSPLNGQVVSIEKREGETISSAETIVKILPTVPFQVKVDIYEEDITKVKVSDPVRIKLIAFSNQEFEGKVVSIEPAEKIVNEVVYYEIIIDFDQEITGLKPGMTADVVIQTDHRQNVLTLPREALLEKDNKFFVRFLKVNKLEEKEVNIGLEGNDGLVEIISGLNENEEVILP